LALQALRGERPRLCVQTEVSLDSLAVIRAFARLSISAKGKKIDTTPALQSSRLSRAVNVVAYEPAPKPFVAHPSNTARLISP
jgi:hypothetical protein